MVVKHSIRKLLYRTTLWVFVCFCSITLIQTVEAIYVIIGVSILLLGAYFLFDDIKKLLDRKEKLVLSEKGMKIFNHFHTWNNIGGYEIKKYGNRFPNYILMVYIIDKADTQYKLDLSSMNVKSLRSQAE